MAFECRIGHWDNSVVVYLEGDLLGITAGNRYFAILDKGRRLTITEVDSGVREWGTTGPIAVCPERNAGYTHILKFADVAIGRGLARFMVDGAQLEVAPDHMFWDVPDDHTLPWPKFTGRCREPEYMARELGIRLRSAVKLGVKPAAVLAGVPDVVRERLNRSRMWADVVMKSVMEAKPCT